MVWWRAGQGRCWGSRTSLSESPAPSRVALPLQESPLLNKASNGPFQEGSPALEQLCQQVERHRVQLNTAMLLLAEVRWQDTRP